MKIKHLSALGLAIVIATPAAIADGRTFGDGLPKFLEQYDANDDGKIDEEERQAVKEAREARHADWIAQWDEDEDGVLSDEEREAAKEAVRAKIEEKRSERFAEIAGDDGLLSLDEFSALPAFAGVKPSRVEALFNHLNTDGEEGVTLEEFTARLRPHRHHHGGYDGPGSDGPK